MKHTISKTILILSLAIAGWIWNGDIRPTSGDLVATAEAIIGRPATPLSYAGVARRTTVRVATPGVGVNMGGPVNRVGRW
ncbi:MAG: hypothetical protein WAK57_08120 [Desulfobacterales bacterium]|jgi:hypothetical protein